VGKLGNQAKFRQRGKILAMWQNSGNVAKLAWQSGEILAIWQPSFSK
jgi:hypothetical protein